MHYHHQYDTNTTKQSLTTINYPNTYIPKLHHCQLGTCYDGLVFVESCYI